MNSAVRALLIVAATSFLTCFALVVSAAESADASTTTDQKPQAFTLIKSDFNLGNCKNMKQSSLAVLNETFSDQRLPKELKPEMKIEVVSKDTKGEMRRELYYAFPNKAMTQNQSVMGPQIEQADAPRIMGMTAQQAQLASRDGMNMRPCSGEHEQGDLSNRWCHAAISQSVVEAVLGEDGNPITKTLAECLFWAPKEFLYDLNPSAHDIGCSYKDKLGTKRSTFEVRVHADAVFDDHFKKVQAGKGSFPTLTWRRAFGPSSRD